MLRCETKYDVAQSQFKLDRDCTFFGTIDYLRIGGVGSPGLGEGAVVEADE